MCTCQCILYSHLCIVSLVTLIGFVRCRHILHGYLYVVPSVTFMGFVTVCLFSYGCMLFTSSGRENENYVSGKPCIWLQLKYGCNVNEVCILLQPTCCLLVNSEDASAYYYLFIIICFSGATQTHANTHTFTELYKGTINPERI